MKVVTKRNTYGGSFSVGYHIDSDTEAGMYPTKEEGEAVIHLGDLSIYGTDEDFELLANMIEKHIRAQKREKVSTF